MEDNIFYKIKRNIISYISHILIIILFLNGVLAINTTAFELIDIINICGLVLFSITFIRICIFPYYLIFRKDLLIIYRLFFIKEKIPLNRIKKFISKEGNNSRSYFLTVEDKKVKISNSIIKYKDHELIQLLINKYGAS